MDQITASPADRADVAVVLRTLGPVAVVRMVPVTTWTAGTQRCRTHVTLFDATGADLTDRLDAEGARIARDTVRAAFPGRVWTRDAFDYHAGTGLLTVVTALRVPPREVVPLADALAADDAAPAGWLPNGGHDAGCAYVGGIGPRCTCSPADDDPPTVVLGRPVVDVPVQDGGVL